ncbi:unnamed protein product [Lactuca saligna]|uniref:Uncharacterized protein n=1 Tax=Lactuca saligna TaxID=75948 RepID=A0AA36E311_LACSI|nr:unnamed protein product [Lactuca saligna]
MPTPIQTPTVYQGESSSNFETNVLSQPSLLVKITQSLGERLTILEKGVPEVIYNLGEDDYMVTDEIPPNSPSDNPPSPPLPSSNSPPPSQPPPHTPSPPPGSPP